MAGSLGALVTVLATLEGLRHAGVVSPSTALPEQRTRPPRPAAHAAQAAPCASVPCGTSAEEVDDPPAVAASTSSAQAPGEAADEEPGATGSTAWMKSRVWVRPGELPDEGLVGWAMGLVAGSAGTRAFRRHWPAVKQAVLVAVLLLLVPAVAARLYTVRRAVRFLVRPCRLAWRGDQ